MTVPLGSPEYSGNCNTQIFDGQPCSLDDRFGGRWHQLPQQLMTDPLWQPMYKEVCSGEDYQLLVDDGSCKNTGYTVIGDSIVEARYYPLGGLEEARIGPPMYAPALPSGITLLTPCDVGTINGIGCAAANTTFYAPPMTGVSRAPWVTQLNMEQCVDNHGRWACRYANVESACADEDMALFDPP